jgi:hypothetical protein
VAGSPSRPVIARLYALVTDYVPALKGSTYHGVSERAAVIVTFGAQSQPVDRESIDPMVLFDAVAARLD